MNKPVKLNDDLVLIAWGLAQLHTSKDGSIGLLVTEAMDGSNKWQLNECVNNVEYKYWLNKATDGNMPKLTGPARRRLKIRYMEWLDQ